MLYQGPGLYIYMYIHVYNCSICAHESVVSVTDLFVVLKQYLLIMLVIYNKGAYFHSYLCAFPNHLSKIKCCTNMYMYMYTVHVRTCKSIAMVTVYMYFGRMLNAVSIFEMYMYVNVT